MTADLGSKPQQDRRTTPFPAATPGMPQADANDLTERYLLGDLLGAGGSATVYEATERATGERRAIKIFTVATHATTPAPEHRSFRAQAELEHPGLVEVFETGRRQNHAYIVMELIEGGALSDRIARGPLPVVEVAAIGARLAAALAHVHGSGVVHRDVKPANVLIDADMNPFLTDFGASRVIGATRVTVSGTAVGTPAYMAPEQVRGERVGPAADVYSLGLVLLEAVTGRREYSGGVVESAVARLHRRPEVPRYLPDELRTALTAMTAQEPADRPAAAEVAVLLAAPGAAPAGPGGRPGPARMRIALAAAVALAFVLAVPGTFAQDAAAPFVPVAPVPEQQTTPDPGGAVPGIDPGRTAPFTAATDREPVVAAPVEPAEETGEGGEGRAARGGDDRAEGIAVIAPDDEQTSTDGTPQGKAKGKAKQADGHPGKAKGKGKGKGGDD